jgi:hypothetical protein
MVIELKYLRRSVAKEAALEAAITTRDGIFGGVM